MRGIQMVFHDYLIGFEPVLFWGVVIFTVLFTAISIVVAYRKTKSLRKEK